MQRGPDVRAVAALVTALAIITLSAILNQSDVDRASDAQGRVKRCSEIKLRLQAALAELYQAETSARGYQLTGNEQFVRDFQSASDRFRLERDSLSKLIDNDADQSNRLKELQSWTDLRIEGLNSLITKMRRGSRSSDAETINAGNSLSARIREQIQKIATAQDGILEASNRQFDAGRTGSHNTFLITALLSALFVIFAFLVVLRILSDREQSAEKVRDANERFKLASEAVQGAIYDWNLKTGEVVRADQFAAIIGYQPSEVPDNLNWWQEQVHPDDLSILKQGYKDMVEKGGHYGFEYRIRHRDGHYISIWDKGLVLRDSEDKPVRIVGSTMDITDRVEAERNRRISDALVEQILESSQDCIVAVDLDSNLVLMNSHGQQSLGIMNFASRRGSPWVELWAKNDRDHAAEAVDLARQGEVGRFQGCLLAADGSQRWWDVMATPIMDDDGDVYRVLTIARDFTEEREAQEALRDRQREIEDLNRRLQRAVAESHHRIKNNLQVLVSLVETMRFSVNRTAPPGELERLARHIRGLAVLHDLLTNETRTPNTDLDTVPVRGILERLIPILEMAAGGQKVACEIDDIRLTLKQCSAVTLLVNELISNALKHGAGEVSLTLRQERQTLETDVFLIVADNGPGFPPDFDPLAAANTGLDLIESIGRWDLGGDIRYGNSPEGGGQVTIQFPLILSGSVSLPDSVDPGVR